LYNKTIKAFNQKYNVRFHILGKTIIILYENQVKTILYLTKYQIGI